MLVEIRDRPSPLHASTVLIVDDEPDILESLVDYLQAAMPKVKVMTAGSGEEAIQIAEKGGLDVIVSDLRMPGMNGLALLGAVQKQWPNVQCILMTAFSEADLDRRAREEGVEVVLRKPFEMARFESMLVAALKV